MRRAINLAVLWPGRTLLILLPLACLSGCGSSDRRAARDPVNKASDPVRAVSDPVRVINDLVPAVSVFPIPGSRVASPDSQITFRGVAIGSVRDVTVSGSHSGAHSGRLVADYDGQGGSFVPNKSFEPGEVVTVKTHLHILGAPGGVFHFRVATPAASIPNAPAAPPARIPGDVLQFRSRPDLSPASVELTTQTPDAAPGDIFLAPQEGPVQNGPMILDPNGELIWFKPLPAQDSAADFRVQQFEGRPVLTWWQGYVGLGVGAGEDVIANTSYRDLATVHAGNGLWADLHEFEIVGRSTALITSYYPVYWNTTSVHGAQQAVVFDCVVQAIDIPTGLVLFQWDSLDHVPVTDSYEPPPQDPTQPYDYFHVNSIDVDQDGNLLVSARNTWTVYKINRQSGAVIWRLGGKRSNFRFASGASFAFQHDFRVLAADDRTATVFDDGDGPPKVHAQSRALTLQLDTTRMTATLVDVDEHSPSVLTNYEGNVQLLPERHQFVGWGSQPYFAEFDAQGRIVFDARFVDENSNYRAFRFPWHATPDTPPAVAASSAGRSTIVYVSWNGATDVQSWRVLGGDSAGTLRPLTTAFKQGFETQITVPAQRFVEVQALNESGRVMATSAAVHTG